MSLKIFAKTFSNSDTFFPMENSPDLITRFIVSISSCPQDDVAKGYIKQHLAEYTHHINPKQSQQILLTANRLNPQVLRPVNGISYTRLSSIKDQAAKAREFMVNRIPKKNKIPDVSILVRT